MAMWASFEKVRTSNELALFLSFEAYAAVLIWSNRQPHDVLGGVIAEADGGSGWFLMAFYPLLTLGLVALVLFHLGGLRCEDVGWRREMLVPAACASLLFWLCSQAALVLLARLQHEEILAWRGV